jgi:hypothetical protein
MEDNKIVRTPESDRVRGYRREIQAGNITIPTNNRSIQSVVGESTMPMRTTIECTPSRQRKGRQGNFPGMLSSPCNYKVTKSRAPAEEMHNAAKHSPEVETHLYGTPTLKHPAFTARKNRNDQEE